MDAELDKLDKDESEEEQETTKPSDNQTNTLAADAQKLSLDDQSLVQS